MKYFIKISLTALLFFIVCSKNSSAQTKLAQTGFQFLSVCSDARASAMGEAVTAVPEYSGALFFNPAAMADNPKNFSAGFSLNSWIADINHYTFSMTYRPALGQYGVIGLSLQSVDYGDVLGTMVWDNSKGYVDTETLNPAALAVGVGYAKMLSSRFSVGGHVRFAYQNLGKSVITDDNAFKTKQNTANTMTFDFGTLFKTGYKSIAFGMSVRNFSNEIKYEEEEFELPLIFNLGVSMDVTDWVDIPGPEQSLLVSVDATHPRAHPEQIKIGLEYKLMQILSLRTGYIANNDEDDLAFGFGVSSFGFEFDYAYTPFGVFGNVQRMTARISL